MHLESVLKQMRAMRLSTMADSLEVRLKAGDHQGLSHEEFFSLLVNDEHEARQSRKLAMMIKRAGFKPESACLENIHHDEKRGFRKMDIVQFYSDTWIRSAQNVILTGPTGSGKTYLAEAISLQACKLGFPAQKKRFKMLFEEIHEAKGVGLYLKYLKKLEKAKVLILDDFMMTSIQKRDLDDLMDLIELREQVGSIIITSQYPVDTWHLKMADKTIADAICDRLQKGAFIFNLKGDSMRK